MYIPGNLYGRLIEGIDDGIAQALSRRKGREISIVPNGGISVPGDSPAYEKHSKEWHAIESLVSGISDARHAVDAHRELMPELCALFDRYESLDDDCIDLINAMLSLDELTQLHMNCLVFKMQEDMPFSAFDRKFNDDVVMRIHTKRHCLYGCYDVHGANDWILYMMKTQSLKDGYMGFSANLNWMDTSGVMTMKDLFKGCVFNGDISLWDTGNVTDMSGMFEECATFTGKPAMVGDIRCGAFISGWDVRGVRDMSHMFSGSEFDGNVRDWEISPECKTHQMFFDCPVQDGNMPACLKAQGRRFLRGVTESFDVPHNAQHSAGYYRLSAFLSECRDKTPEFAYDHMTDKGREYIRILFDNMGTQEDDVRKLASENARLIELLGHVYPHMDRFVAYMTGDSKEEPDERFVKGYIQAISETNPLLAGYFRPFTLMDLKTIVSHAPGDANLNWVDTTQMSSLNSLFYGKKFHGDISMWNTGNVLTMNMTFMGSDFNGDISGWNTSRVRDMSGMFKDSSFNGDISGWDTRKVISMSRMFENSKFDSDISGWNVSRVQDMSHMFENSAFTGALTGWKTGNVRNFESMFRRTHFDGDMTGWKFTKAVNMRYMFGEAWDFNVDISKWRLPETVDMTGFMKGAGNYSQDISKMRLPERFAGDFSMFNGTRLPAEMMPKTAGEAYLKAEAKGKMGQSVGKTDGKKGK